MAPTQTSLSATLRSHALWIANPAAGRRADLSESTFNDTDLSGVTLSRALLIGTTFLDSNLSRADLTGTRLDRADLQRANLAGADFTGATLADTGAVGRVHAGSEPLGSERHPAPSSTRPACPRCECFEACVNNCHLRRRGCGRRQLSSLPFLRSRFRPEHSQLRHLLSRSASERPLLRRFRHGSQFWKIQNRPLRF